MPYATEKRYGIPWVLDSFKESNHVRRGRKSTAELRLSLRERVARAAESRASEQDGSSQRSALFRQWRPLSYPSSWSAVSSGPWGSCWTGKRTSAWPSASSWPWGQPEACTGTRGWVCLPFRLTQRQAEKRLEASLSKSPNLANKNTRGPVKLEFQISNKQF